MAVAPLSVSTDFHQTCYIQFTLIKLYLDPDRAFSTRIMPHCKSGQILGPQLLKSFQLLFIIKIAEYCNHQLKLIALIRFPRVDLHKTDQKLKLLLTLSLS